jgi:catechol 2,3-dioxygenase-like lactoylglutathione lyase family enzyme
LDIELLHHVALTTSDLERSRAFYRDILGLVEIERPPFSFPGAWFQVGDSWQLRLIVHDRAALPRRKLTRAMCILPSECKIIQAP